MNIGHSYEEAMMLSLVLLHMQIWNADYVQCKSGFRKKECCYVSARSCIVSDKLFDLNVNELVS